VDLIFVLAWPSQRMLLCTSWAKPEVVQVTKQTTGRCIRLGSLGCSVANETQHNCLRAQYYLYLTSGATFYMCRDGADFQSEED
jgi:hypothetical protein